jgi:acetyl esterase/lipase
MNSFRPNTPLVWSLALLSLGSPAVNAETPRAPLPATASAARFESRKNVPYADTEDIHQQLDIYQPKQRASKKLPVVVFFHGGGWRAGNKAMGSSVLPRLVLTEQFIGISAGYRLTPQVKWPDPLYDCKAAVRWIKAHASELGADPDRIAVWGSSAGAHLASLLGTTGEQKDLEGLVGKHLDQNSKIRCVVNFFGPQNFLTILGQEESAPNNNADSAVGMLLGGRVRDLPELAKAASPLFYVSTGTVPFLSAHGTKDPLVPFEQAQELHKALRKAGVESTLIEMTDAGHGFRSPELDARIDQFLARHLLGKTVEIAATPIPKGQ